MQVKGLLTHSFVILLLFSVLGCKREQQEEAGQPFDITGHWVTVKDIDHYSGDVTYLNLGTEGSGTLRIDRVSPQGGVVLSEAALVWSVISELLMLELDDPDKQVEIYKFEFADKGNELLLTDKNHAQHKYYREIFD